MKALRLLFVSIWIVFFAGSLLMSALHLLAPLQNPRWYIDESKKSYELIDFSQFYQSGQLAISPRSQEVYDPAIQDAWAAKLVAPCKTEKIFYNQSVPFLFVLMVPFGFLPYGQAYVLWCLLTATLALGALAWLTARAGFLRGAGRFFFLSGVAASLPFYLTVWHGQSTFLLTALLALFALFLFQKRNLAAGICLAFSTFKPQYLLPFIALSLGMQRLAAVVSLLVAEAVLMGLAATLIGSQNVLGYAHVLTAAEASGNFVGVNPQVMASLRGILSGFMPHKAAMFTTIAVLLGSLLPLALGARRLLKRTGASPSYLEANRWLIATTFVLALVVSPHTHYFDCLLLAIPAALTLPTVDLAGLLFARHSDVEGLTLPHRIWCIILLLFPLVSWPLNYCCSREVEGALFLAIDIILLGLAVWRLRHLYTHLQDDIYVETTWH